MRSRLAFGLSMAIDFDFYLVDEILGVGDARFKNKCAAIIESKRHKSNMVMVSHSEGVLRKFCNCAFWLRDGQLYYFEEISVAIKEYNLFIKSFK
jgi:capsular polysaccharide transport system ATP-binding protein